MLRHKTWESFLFSSSVFSSLCPSKSTLQLRKYSSKHIPVPPLLLTSQKCIPKVYLENYILRTKLSSTITEIVFHADPIALASFDQASRQRLQQQWLGFILIGWTRVDSARSMSELSRSWCSQPIISATLDLEMFRRLGRVGGESVFICIGPVITLLCS
jgi:hypothetical protein